MKAPFPLPFTQAWRDQKDSWLDVDDAFVTPATFDPVSKTHAGAAYGPGGAVIPATERGRRKPWRSVDPKVATRPERGLRLERGIYLGHFFPHFGHFLVETVTSLWHGLDRDEPLVFHPWENYRPSSLDLPFIAQSLDALGVPKARIVVADQLLHVGRLLVPPHNDAILGKPQKDALAVYGRLSAALCGAMPDFEARLVYMSRRFYRKSLRASNEADVEREFARRGFRVVYPEQLTFREQVHLVRNAQVLAGIGGSALHLSGFMAPGTLTLLIGNRMLPALAGINDGLGAATRLLPTIGPAPLGSRYEYEVDVGSMGRELDRLDLKVRLIVP